MDTSYQTKTKTQKTTGGDYHAPQSETQTEHEHRSPAGLPLFMTGGTPPPAIQPKLRINRPGDRYEQQADRAADSVMRSCSCGGTCARCRGKRGANGVIQRQANGASGAALPASPGVAASGLLPSNGGQPLDGTTRSDFETQFGQDLGGVRVHTGPDAAQRAQSIGAQAFTAGHDIVFDAGEYAPESTGGRHLLAHELAHVVQQRGGGVPDVQRNGGEGDEAPAVDVENFDPCGIDERPLGHRNFLQVLEQTKNYIDDTERGEDRWYDYANLLRRLAAERRRRANLGHIWLYDVSGADVPPYLYRLQPGKGMTVRIYREESSAVLGRNPHVQTSSTMTQGQLEDFRARHNIEQTDIRSHFNQQDPNAIQRPLEFEMPTEALPSASPGGIQPGNPFRFMAGDPFGLQGGANPLMPGPFGGPMGGDYRTMAIASQFGGRMGRSSLFGLQALPLSDPTGLTISQGSYNKFRGSMAETMMASGSPTAMLRQQNLNRLNIAGMDPSAIDARIAGLMPAGTTPEQVSERQLTTWQGNNPIWDVTGRNLPLIGDPSIVSIKTHIPSEGTSISDWGTYEGGFADIAGRPGGRSMSETGFYAASLGLINEGTGRNITMDEALRNARLAVNADHVEQVRERIAQRARGEIAAPGREGPPALETYKPMHDADLRNRPIEIGTERYTSVDDLRSARDSGAITAQDFDNAVNDLVNRTTQRVVSNGLSTAELRNIESYTRQYHGQLLTANEANLSGSVRQGNIITNNTTASRRQLALDLANRPGNMLVNSDQVSDVRAEVRRTVRGEDTSRNRPLSRYSAQHNADLAQNPLTLHGKEYTNVAELRQDHRSGTLSDADFASAVDQLADRMAQRVVSNNLTTPQVAEVAGRAQQQLESSYRGGQHAELIDAVRRGTIVTDENGNMQVIPNYRGATLRSMGRGGALGLGMSAVTEGYAAWNDPRVSGWDYARNVGLSTGGAMLEAGAEARLGMYVSETQLARTAANPAMAGRYAQFARYGRLGGSTAIGAMLTPAVVLSMMALDDQEYTTIDYTAVGTRYAAGGAVSVLGSAGAGAAFGSVVPGAGTAVGFVVGLAGGAIAFYVFDAAVGDEIEQGVRHAMGEQGCTEGIRTDRAGSEAP